MRVQLNSETFVEITSPSSGTIQNISPSTPVEICSTEEAGTGIVLQPYERLQYDDSTSVYARSVWDDADAAYIVAEPFKRAAGGGGSSYTLPAATATKLGGVKIGSNVTVQNDGTISVPAPYSLPTAAADTLGGVKIGSNVSIDENGVISVAAPYSLPTAAENTLGGVKVGSGLTITDGVLSATGGGGGGGGASYSTTEQVVGTWIDGKPLYQITYNATAPSTTNTSEEIAELPANVDSTNVVDAKFILYTASGYIYPTNFYLSANDMDMMWFRPNKKIVMQVSAPDHANATVYITIQYTKTTD